MHISFAACICSNRRWRRGPQPQCLSHCSHWARLAAFSVLQWLTQLHRSIQRSLGRTLRVLKENKWFTLYFHGDNGQTLTGWSNCNYSETVPMLCCVASIAESSSSCRFLPSGKLEFLLFCLPLWKTKSCTVVRCLNFACVSSGEINLYNH